MNAHGAVGGPARGRRYEVEGINRAAVLMLCAHFEGYLEDVMAEALAAVNASLAASVVTGGFHNPWPDRIDDLFAFVGMKNPSKTISWQKAGNGAVKSNLNNLVRTRNKIAHGTTGVVVYKSDVTRFRRYVEGFAKRFDTKLRTQIRSISGTNPW
jgi:hypothetical protein